MRIGSKSPSSSCHTAFLPCPPKSRSVAVTFDDVGDSFRQTRVTQRSCRALLIAEATPSRLMMMMILYLRHRLCVDISRKLSVDDIGNSRARHFVVTQCSCPEATPSRLMMMAILYLRHRLCVDISRKLSGDDIGDSRLRHIVESSFSTNNFIQGLIYRHFIQDRTQSPPDLVQRPIALHKAELDRL